jgi:translation initiation factor IF-3
MKHIRRFLSEGNKCKLAIVFRGREIVHPETGQAMLDTVVKMISDIATVEQKATMEGRRMVMLVGPRSGVIRRPPSASDGPPPTGPVMPAPPAQAAAAAAPKVPQKT